MEAICLNRLDQMMRAGTYPRPIHLPHARLGCEGTGTIDAVGEGVEQFRIGDAVIVTALPASDLNGTYADYTTVPASAVIVRPDGLDAVHSAALWVAGSTAYGALIEKAHMRPADHVLITAASSGVGLAAIQVANQIGAVPMAVTRQATKRDALLAAGASAVIVTVEEDLQESVSPPHRRGRCGHHIGLRHGPGAVRSCTDGQAGAPWSLSAGSIRALHRSRRPAL